MAAVLRCVLVCALVACVLGHAVLLDPTPLNTNPTTQQVCGVSSLPAKPYPAAQWLPGQSVTIEWQLIATDGGKTVTGAIDAQGDGKVAGDFNVPIFTGAMDGGLKKYTYTFTVPSTLRCDPICLFRVYTETNWNSCTYINVTCPGCPAPPPPPPKKVDPNTGNSGLDFCKGEVDDTLVYVPDDTSIATLDNNAEGAYNKNYKNPNVFLSNSSECGATYKTFVCRDNLVPVAGSDATISSMANCDLTCKNLNKVCQLNELHAALYDCTTYPKCLGESGASFLSVSLSLAAALFLALLL